MFPAVLLHKFKVQNVYFDATSFTFTSLLYDLTHLLVGCDDLSLDSHGDLFVSVVQPHMHHVVRVVSGNMLSPVTTVLTFIQTLEVIIIIVMIIIIIPVVVYFPP